MLSLRLVRRILFVMTSVYICVLLGLFLVYFGLRWAAWNQIVQYAKNGSTRSFYHLLPEGMKLGGERYVKHLVRQLRNPDPQTRTTVLKQLKFFRDPKSIALLLRMIEDQHEAVGARCAAIDALMALVSPRAEGPLTSMNTNQIINTLTPLLEETPNSLRVSAMDALDELGAIPKESYEHYLVVLEDDEPIIRERAMVFLSKQEKDYHLCEALLAANNSKYDSIRSFIASELRKSRSSAWSRNVMWGLRDPSDSVKREAIWTLLIDHHTPERSIPDLIHVIEDKTASDFVRAGAALLLGELKAQGAIQPLIALLSEDDAFLTDMAYFALRQITGKNFVKVAAIWERQLLEGTDEIERLIAAGKIPVTASMQIQELVRSLTNHDASERAEAAYALGMMLAEHNNPEMSWLAEFLEPLVHDPDADVRKFARWAFVMTETGAPLHRQGNDKAQVVAQSNGSDSQQASLDTLARDDERIESAIALLYVPADRDKMKNAIHFLGKSRKDLTRIGNHLSFILTRRDAYLADDLYTALGKIGEPAFGCLFALAKDCSWQMRIAALNALSHAGDSRASEVIDTLLQDPNPEVCAAAQKAHERIETSIELNGDRRFLRTGPASIDDWIADLKSEHSNVRLEAVLALEKLKDPRAVESLIAALYDKDSNVRIWARNTLRDSRDPRAVKAFIDYVNNSGDNDALRNDFINALGWMGDSSSVEPLIGWLRNERGEAQARAAESLGKLRDLRAIGPLQEMLQKAIQDDNDFQWRIKSALEALESISENE